MDDLTSGYKIAQVEEMTGVGRHTLRAWERRYGVPAPDRSGGRQRMYSAVDIELVNRMRDLSARGIPLARAAATIMAAPQAPSAVTIGAVLREQLGRALLAWDEAEAIAVWTEIFERYDTVTAFDNVIAPLLRNVGDAWHAGQVSVAQEHFISNFVRSRLEVQNRQVVPAPSAATVLLACVEGEHHELGLLALAAVLRLHGLRTVYLGRDMPATDLRRVVEDVQPDVIALHAGSPGGVERLAALLPELGTAAPLARLVYGGWPFDSGAASVELPGGTYGGATLGASAELITALIRRSGRGGKK